MYRLTWCTSDCANREALRHLFCIAVVTFRFPLPWSAAAPFENLCRAYFLNDLHLPIEAGCATLDKRPACRQTQLIDMPPRLKIVQRIENEIEGLKPVYIELGIFDVGMMRLELDVRIELRRALLCDLAKV